VPSNARPAREKEGGAKGFLHLKQGKPKKALGGKSESKKENQAVGKKATKGTKERNLSLRKGPRQGKKRIAKNWGGEKQTPLKLPKPKPNLRNRSQREKAPFSKKGA